MEIPHYQSQMLQSAVSAASEGFIDGDVAVAVPRHCGHYLQRNAFFVKFSKAAESNFSKLHFSLVAGIIKNGGVKPNIIPDYTELEFYLRAPSLKDLADLQEKAHACFNSAATATGCKVELSSTSHDFFNVLPNKTLAKTYIENGKQLGMQFSTDDLVLNALSGSTDFGNVTYEVPGIHPYFFIGSDALNHTAEYTEAAGSKEAQYYTLRTAKSLAMTALDVIFNPELLENIRQDWKMVRQVEEEILE